MIAVSPIWPLWYTETPIATIPLYPEPRLSVVPNPTDTILPPAPTTAVTAAPTSGAYPRPVEDPREIIIPPLGVWFWFISEGEIIMSFVTASLIPENTTLDIPTLEFSIILKLFFGLFKVSGVWKTLFMNNIPFPPVVPSPTVLAPPTLNVNVLPIPVNWSEISS